MKIVVACPSYRRPKVETLEYLPYCRVYVDIKEAQEYIDNNKGADIVACPEGVQGNLCRVRNYMLDTEFTNGADAVCIIDDDMKGMARFEVRDGFGYEDIQLKTNDFMPFLEKYTLLCKEWGFYLWGVNCNSDKTAYRHYTPFSTISYIGGPFMVHLKNPMRFDEDLPLKEDYDITLQHCNEYRGVLRVNAYHYYVKQAKQAGGCATYRTNEKEKEQFLLLQRKWGGKIVKKDKGSRRSFDFNPIIHIPIKGV